MLGFLSPGWLLGLATLTLPLALHLWSRRGGRPIRVGSIRLLLGAPAATRRSWSIRDPALLLLRCSVLAALVLALAGPYWSPRAASGVRWALIADDVAARNVLVDSLTRAGLVVYPLGGTSTVHDRPQNLWTALGEADRAAPPGTRFEVFGPQQLRYFRGERPTIGARVEWHAREPATLAGTGPAMRHAARLVAIFADGSRAEDARYVRAAIEAAGQATGIAAVVTLRAAGPGVASGPADWIVWLSARPVPGAVLDRVRNGATLLTDAGSQPPRDRRSRILLVDRPSDAWLTRGSAVTDSAAPLWTDGSGGPVLTVARDGRGSHYRFHGRFNPAWSELVLRAAFPEALARLWIGPDSAGSRHDDRPIALRQLLPARDSTASPPPPPPTNGRSLFVPVWLLALALFAFERWFAAQPRRRPA
jgi:hypothetical protein